MSALSGKLRLAVDNTLIFWCPGFSTSLNASLQGRGVSCQCMECLYNRWYWKQQYGLPYPEKPAWATNGKSMLDPSVYKELSEA